LAGKKQTQFKVYPERSRMGQFLLAYSTAVGLKKQSQFGEGRNERKVYYDKGLR